MCTQPQKYIIVNDQQQKTHDFLSRNSRKKNTKDGPTPVPVQLQDLGMLPAA